MVQASAMSSADASKRTALVQSSSASKDSDMEVGAPDPAVYESKSSGIVSTLEGLLEKAQGQLDEARKKETAALHNFEMLKQSLEDQMKFADEDLAETKQGLAECKESA